MNHFQLSGSPSTQAVILQKGANIYDFSINGRQYLAFGDQYGAGNIMLPFPNRVDGGKYNVGGITHQLPINELQRNNAIAGLVRDVDWIVTKHTANELILKLLLDEPSGYPFKLLVQVTYQISEGRLTVTTRTKNVGQTPAPYGVGFHPYLKLPGTPSIDVCSLQIPASSYLRVTTRMIPFLPAVAVDRGPYDFRTLKQVGSTVLDTCFTDLTPDGDGLTRIKLRGFREEVVVFMDSAFKYLQVYSGDTLPASDRRIAIALEPQTCAPDAFNNALGLLTLAPGAEHRCQWGIDVN
jgi:aldose 1-epimerase